MRRALPYARNLLATIDSVYGRCAVEVLHKNRPLAGEKSWVKHLMPPEGE